ncbi:MerR family transcriptional regulator [Ectobacillus funiculus]|uniref:MerR family transcriptional regulator n=1 Tax=Ectobacillus funiculus TaxID=137993 RepID=UPI0013EB2508|nr:MerR family transcriptional regulator [Ectobacillus funiculus]
MEFGYFAAEVCKDLNLNSNTLRKWSLALEDAQYKFERNPRNQRIYYEKDITLLKLMKNLMADGSRTLEDAVQTLINEQDNAEITHSVLVTENSKVTVKERYQEDLFSLFQETNKQLACTLQQQEIIAEQNKQILGLLLEERQRTEKERKNNAEIQKENEELKERLNRVLDYIEKQEENNSKKSFLQRILNL